MARREVLVGGASLVITAGAPPPRFAAGLAHALPALERQVRGTIGLTILDTATGARFDWRGDERFAMCSVFKFVLVAAILARVEHGGESLERRIAIAALDIIDHSPFTETRVERDAGVGELCEATITLSDNAAANLLLPAIGGPPGWTRFVRAQRDDISRLDRTEPTLNTATPGDPRDTTTPRAMAALLHRLSLGNGLRADSRAQLVTWMRDTRTGDARLRAGLPPGWRLAEKTGAGNGSDNDVAVLWPPQRAPLIVASFIRGSPLPLPATNAAQARIGALVRQLSLQGL